MTSQNPRRDERTLVRMLADMQRRLRALETAPRAGHTSISNGKLLIIDPDTGDVIASLAGAVGGMDPNGNPVPAGLGAEVGSVNGGVVQAGSIDASKVSFTVRDLSGITTTVSAIEPTDPVEGDLWIDSGNGNVITRFDGTSWTALPVGTNAIQAGAVTASQIAANTITAGQIAAGAITAATIAAGAIDGEVITGATVITDSATGGIRVYSGTPTLGNLIVSIAAMAGTDDYGNSYPSGVDVLEGSIAGSQITIEPGAGNGIFVYGSAPTVTTFTSGSGTWTAPAGVTSVLVECWGGGGGGSGYDSSFGSAGGGGGGGEYAAQTIAVTPGNSYPYAVGAGGAGAAANSVFAGGDGDPTSFNSTGVVAHGGSGALVAGSGGSGSTNTTHFNGGGGAAGSGTVGGGGGGSGGTGSAGNAGTAGGGGGAGAVAVAGGGPGGNHDVAPVSGPGGGGGGGSTSKAGKAGVAGRVTIATSGASPVLIGSIAGASGTDQYGNTYPAGIFGPSPTFARKTATETITSSTAFQDDDHLSVAVAANATYLMTCSLKYEAGTTGDLKMQWLGPSGTALLGTISTLISTAASDLDDYTTGCELGDLKVAGGRGAGVTRGVQFNGIVVVGGTAGTFKLQWAQNTTDTISTILYANSYVLLQRVA